MSSSASDKAFVGSIPKIYAASLVPLLFEPYAADMAARLAMRPVSRLLELAAGTGVVTRALAASLPRTASIVATDLNQAMLDEAAAAGTPRPVEWRQADAQELPFEAGTFDAIVCQFGVMFFPDKASAFAEARRVLKPGGIYIFNVWDRLEENELAAIITTALADVFPDDAPRFLARTPYAYHDRATIERDITAGGLGKPEFATVTARSRAASARTPALAFCEGTPLRPEIEAHGAGALAVATDAAATAIASRFGAGAIDAGMQALVVTVQG
jgi:SAM-dependent methyltransferase